MTPNVAEFLASGAGPKAVKARLEELGLWTDGATDWLAEAQETLRLLGRPDLARDAGRVAALVAACEPALGGAPWAAAVIGAEIEGPLETAAREIALWRGLLPADAAVALARNLGWRGKQVIPERAPKARRLLLHALGENPADVDALISFALLLGGAERSSEAASWLARGVEMLTARLAAQPSNLKLRRRLSHLLRLAGNSAAELEQLEALYLAGERSRDTLVLLARARRTAGRPEAALEALLELKAQGTMDAAAALHLAELHALQGDRGRAREEILDLVRAPAPPSQLARGFEALAEVASAEDALGELLRPEARHLQHSELARLAARLLFGVGRYDEAVAINSSRGLAASTDPGPGGRSAEFIGGTTIVVDDAIHLVGVIHKEAMGDLAMRFLWLASAKLHFSRARLTLVTPRLSEAGEALIACCPGVDEHRIVESGDLRDAAAALDGPNVRMFDGWRTTHQNLERLEHRARLVIPSPERARLRQELAGAGVDEGRWLAVIHCRHDASFRGRKASSYVRDASPETFLRVADYIIDELGGQVCWIGHPGMPAIPARAGLVSLLHASVLLQHFTVASARYFVGCDSGPAMVASAFETPALKANSIYDVGAWNAHDIMLPKNVLTADGKVVAFRGLWRRARMHWMPHFEGLDEFFLKDNTFEQLTHCVDLLHARTASVEGWRPLREARVLEHPPQAFPILPSRLAASEQTIELPELLGRPIVRAEDLFATVR